MLRKQQVTNNKKTLNSRAILAVIVAVLILSLILTSVVGLWKKYQAIRSHIKELKQQEEILRNKKSSMATTNEYLATNEGKEEVFRDSYRLVKPGEGIVVITKDNKGESLAPKEPGIIRFWNSIMRGLGLQ